MPPSNLALVLSLASTYQRARPADPESDRRLGRLHEHQDPRLRGWYRGP